MVVYSSSSVTVIDTVIVFGRIVFTAPGAKTASGLDPKDLYEALGNAPITFQGSRALRAYAALKGWDIMGWLGRVEVEMME